MGSGNESTHWVRNTLNILPRAYVYMNQSSHSAQIPTHIPTIILLYIISAMTAYIQAWIMNLITGLFELFTSMWSHNIIVIMTHNVISVYPMDLGLYSFLNQCCALLKCPCTKSSKKSVEDDRWWLMLQREEKSGGKLSKASIYSSQLYVTFGCCY